MLRPRSAPRLHRHGRGLRCDRGGWWYGGLGRGRPSGRVGPHVLVLEAGPDYGSFGGLGWPSDLLDASTIPTSHDWGYRSGAELAGRDLPYERARVIGGCSSHNGCTASWGHRADYDGWAERGLVGWAADDLAPWFQEASQRMRVRRFRDEEVAPLHRAFVEAGTELGLPSIDDLESLDGMPAVCVEPSNSPQGVRWNAAFAYLDPVRGRIRASRSRGGVLVHRIVIEDGRAVGVMASGCAGAPPRRGPTWSWSPGAPMGRPSCCCGAGSVRPRSCGIWALIVADVAGVGRNLHDHPSFELSFEPTDELVRRTQAFAATGMPVPDEQGFAKAATTGAPDGVFDLHVFPETAMDGRTAIFAAYLTPRSRGALTLRGPDRRRPAPDRSRLPLRSGWARPGSADRRGRARSRVRIEPGDAIARGPRDRARPHRRPAIWRMRCARG